MDGDNLNRISRLKDGEWMYAEPIEALDVRKLNRSRIYHALYLRGPQTRQSLSDSLGLSLPTIVQNLRALQQEGLVRESGALESTGGRRARTAAAVPDARLALGMELSDRYVSLIAVDLSGSVQKSEQVLLSFDGGKEAFERLAAIVGRFVQGISELLVGAGIAVSAHVSYDGNTILSAPVPPLHTLTLEAFSDMFPCPFRFFSDMNAMVQSELWGAENERRSLYFLSLSKLVRGAAAAQGCLLPECAVGHLIIHPSGEPCVCGRHGCVEAYCGAQVLEACAGGRLVNFFANLERGNERYQRVWQEYLSNLALTLINLAAASGCEIVLGGSVGCALDDYLDQLRDLAAVYGVPPIKISICGYRNEAAAVGAALVFISEFLRAV